MLIRAVGERRAAGQENDEGDDEQADRHVDLPSPAGEQAAKISTSPGKSLHPGNRSGVRHFAPRAQRQANGSARPRRATEMTAATNGR